jgi:hypothetical protein
MEAAGIETTREIRDKGCMQFSSLASALLMLTLAGCAGAPDEMGDDGDDPDSADDGGSAGSSSKADGGSKTADAGRSSSTTTGTSTNTGSASTGSPGTSVSVGTVSRDGGTKAIVIVTSDASTPSDDPLEGLGGLFGGGGSSDGGTADDSSDGGMCENAVCFDVFDCAIWHIDALDCGFTACTNFVCTK